jgi:hypothetical protein
LQNSVHRFVSPSVGSSVRRFVGNSNRDNTAMTLSHSQRLSRLLEELERVGVDPNTISAGLAVRDDEALLALSALPDRAGPEAFLSKLRAVVSPSSKTE